MEEKKFNPENLEKLNRPERLKDIPPKYIIEKLKLKEPRNIIDIGAGTAYFTIPIANEFPQAQVYACDISEFMVNWMEENISPKYQNIFPRHMEEEYTVPFVDHVADLVLMINLHHELDDPEMMLKECNRLLKTGGKVAIVDWKKEEMPYGPHFDLRYSVEEVEQHLSGAGFKNFEVYNELDKNFFIIAQK